MLDPVIIIFSFNMSKPSQPTLFLIIKLTGSNPKSSLSSSLFFHSFSLTPHIHLIILISVRFIFNSCSTFKGQVSLPCIRQLLTQVAYTLPFIFNKNPFPVRMGRYSRNLSTVNCGKCRLGVPIWIKRSCCHLHGTARSAVRLFRALLPRTGTHCLRGLWRTATISYLKWSGLGFLNQLQWCQIQTGRYCIQIGADFPTETRTGTLTHDDLLNPESVGWDKVSRSSTVPSFKSFRSGHPTNTHTHTHTHHDKVITVSVPIAIDWLRKLNPNHWRLFTIFMLRFMEPETAVKLQFDSFK